MNNPSFAAWPEPPLTPPDLPHATTWERIYDSERARQTHIARAQIIETLAGKRETFESWSSSGAPISYTADQLRADLINNLGLDFESKLLALLLTWDQAERQRLLAEFLPELDRFVEHHAEQQAELHATLETLL